MKEGRRVQVITVMRQVHLYTGLFLTPWLLVYGVSALCLNHGRWLTQTLNIDPPRFEAVRQVKFVPDDTFPQVPAERARAILQQVDLDGAHHILGKPNADRFTVLRPSGRGNYRVTWRPRQSLIVVERQPFSFLRLIHFLHFRHGYGQPYIVHIVWAATVDAVAVSMLLWVISGVYLWVRQPRRRIDGGLLFAAGLVVFAALVALLCM